QLSYTQLTSPIDGVTGIRQIDIGNIIHPTDPNGLVVVTQVEPISVIFTLPETNLPQIQEHLANGALKVEAYSQDNTMKLDEVMLDFIDNEIVQTTGSVRLRANFPNKAHRLWPGQLINAWLLLDTRQNGLTVPAPAVQQGPQGAYVYVINADSTVAVRPVKVAQVSGGRGPSEYGLAPGAGGGAGGPIKLQAGRPPVLLPGQAAADSAGPRTRRQCHDALRALSRASAAHAAADARAIVRRARGLPAAADRGAAKRELSDPSGDGTAARRRSANHGVLGGNAARDAVRPDP